MLFKQLRTVCSPNGIARVLHNQTGLGLVSQIPKVLTKTTPRPNTVALDFIKRITIEVLTETKDNNSGEATIGKDAEKSFEKTATVMMEEKRVVVADPKVDTKEAFLRTEYYKGFPKGYYGQFYFENALHAKK